MSLTLPRPSCIPRLNPWGVEAGTSDGVFHNHQRKLTTATHWWQKGMNSPCCLQVRVLRSSNQIIISHWVVRLYVMSPPLPNSRMKRSFKRALRLRSKQATVRLARVLKIFVESEMSKCEIFIFTALLLVFCLCGSVNTRPPVRRGYRKLFWLHSPRSQRRWSTAQAALWRIHQWLAFNSNKQ